MADSKFLVPWFTEYFSSRRWYNGTWHESVNRTIPNLGPLLNGGDDEFGNRSWAVRLDFEMETDARGNGPANHKARRHMIDVMATDMADLVINGNRSGTDPLLKIYDGEKRSGLTLVDFKSNNIVYYKQYAPKKNTVEYTAWTVIKPVFK